MAKHDSPVLLSIGSGKGGVGKTLILSNLAHLLAKKGFKVALIDLDISCSDLQILHRIYKPKHSLSDFLTQKVPSLNSLMIPLPSAQQLYLIPGTGDSLANTQLQWTQKLRLCHALSRIPVDLVLIDVGAGAHLDTLDFYLEADLPLLIGVPEMTSLFDLSRFVKMATVRYVARAFSTPDPTQSRFSQEFSNVKEFLEATGNMASDQRKRAIKLMKDHQPRLIVNKVTPKSSMKYMQALQSFMGQFTGTHELLGSIPLASEEEVTMMQDQSLYAKQGDSPLSQSLVQIAEKLERLIHYHLRQTPKSLSGKLRDRSLEFFESAEVDFALATDPFQSTGGLEISKTEGVLKESSESCEWEEPMNIHQVDTSRYHIPTGFKAIDVVGMLPSLNQDNPLP